MDQVMFGGFGIMFTIVPMMIFCIFMFVFGTIIYRGIHTAKDKTKPVIPTRAKVISKRVHIWGEHSYTNYYATFEFENGERMEFSIPHNQAGYLVEGDSGILSFQGSLFVKFERI